MRMPLHGKHLKRYGDFAKLLVKYGRSDVLRRAGMDQALIEEVREPQGTAADAQELADDLEKLGPTFIKLGQLLSTRTDLLPPGFVEGLARLQDDVAPFPFAQVEEIVSSELGVRLNKAFLEFEEEPLAAASIGQVHRALLRNGRAVAVKVQRPGIRERIANDLDALEDLARIVDEHTAAGEHFQPMAVLDEFRRSLTLELDYLQEAQNLSILRANLADFDLITVPEPVPDYTTSRVLTMDYVSGRKITDLGRLARLEMNGEELGEQLFRGYLKQILVDGIFHADPHPGNVFLTADGKLALIDVGMIGRIGPHMQDKLLRLLLAVSDGKGETAADIAIDISDPLEDFNRQAFTREVTQFVAQHQTTTVRQIDTGRIILDITRSAANNHTRAPAELALLGKTLLNLDMVARILAPDFDPNEAVRRNAYELLRHRLTKVVSSANVISAVMDMNEFVQQLPGRMNRVLERVADDEFTIRVEAFDEHRLMGGMQKIANRITLGLVLAALIVGAAMMMRVPTTWRILGYPGFAMLFFLAAAAGGLYLVVSILFTDE